MTDELDLLDRLGAQLDAPADPPARLRSRVMEGFMTAGTLPHATAPQSRRRALARSMRSPRRAVQSWWLLPGVAAAAAAVLIAPTVGGVWPGGGPQTVRLPHSAPAAVAPRATESHAVDTSVFGGGDSDHMVFDSPEALAADSNITAVFAGQVAGFRQGRTLSGAGVEEKHVVMKIAVSEAFKGAGNGEGFAYVEMPQPLCAGNVPCSTVADFTEAVPAGTKVMVFGEDAREEASPDGKYVDNQAGRPAGAGLIQPTPQGLLFESATAGGTTVVGAYEKVEDMPEGWRDSLSAGIDGLSTRLKAAGIHD